MIDAFLLTLYVLPLVALFAIAAAISDYLERRFPCQK